MLVHSDLLSVYFCDEHQKPNYFGLMIPKKLKSFEKLDKTTIIKAIKCEKPGSKIKNYVDITRSRGRGVFEVLRQMLSPVMMSSYNQNRCCISCTRHTEEKLNTKFTYQLKEKDMNLH